MVKCLGCIAEVYFDQKLHVKLLREKGLNPDDVMKEGSKLRDDGLGSGRPFDFESDPPTVHQCPGFNKKKGEWTGRANTTKNTYHGYVYNAYNVEEKNTNETNTRKPAIIPPPVKLSDYTTNNNKSKSITTSSSKADKEVIVFSEQSILETQNRIIKDMEALSKRIETMYKTIDFIKYLLIDTTRSTTEEDIRT